MENGKERIRAEGNGNEKGRETGQRKQSTGERERRKRKMESGVVTEGSLEWEEKGPERGKGDEGGGQGRRGYVGRVWEIRM